MTGLWSIVTPQASTNYMPNPSFHKDSTGWTNYTASSGAGTNTRTANAALQGFFGYRLAKTGTTGDWGTYWDPSDISAYTSGNYIVASAFVRVPSGARFKFEIYSFGATAYFLDEVIVDGPYTGRIEISPVILTEDLAEFILYAYIPASYGGTCDIDGVQVEVSSTSNVATTYFDGDTPGCYWTGLYYASTSVRPATVRDGGKIENFDSYGFYITSLSDAGMASVSHNIDDYAVQDGSLYRSARTPQRVFSVTGDLIGTSLLDLHDKRRALIDLFKNDVTGKNEPFWLRYTGGGETMQIQCRYDSGLSGHRSGRNGFTETLGLRFIAEDPYWYRDYTVGVALTARKTISTLGPQILARIDGEWDEFDTSNKPNSTVNAAVYHEGAIYIGGQFSAVGTVPNTAYIAKWDGTSWSALGTGAAGGWVYALAIAPNGDLYAGGTFTSMGGVANTAYIARWDGSAWNALGTGANAQVLALASAPGNLMYAGGSFTTMNGVTHNRIARWNTESLSWGTAMSSGVDDQYVSAFAVAPNGSLYLAGNFTSVSSVANTAYIARWSGTAFSALGTGTDGRVYQLLTSPNGNIFLAGTFTTANGVTVNRLAEWNGVTFLALAGGASGAPALAELQFMPNGDLAIGGSVFTSIGGVTVDDFAFWNGSGYYAPDLYSTATMVINTMTGGGKYELVIAGTIDDVYSAYNNSITNNGTRSASPRFRIEATDAGSSYAFSLYSFELHEAGKQIRFNPWSFNPGEVMTIDTRPGHVSVRSNVRGALLGSVNKTSTLGSFALLPGSNSLLAFATYNNATYDISMIWNERYWSADGSD